MPATYSHPIFGRIYPWISRTADAAGGIEHRRLLLAGLSGQVIEVGAGHGLNFQHYPRAVTRVVAIEPESHLRALAEAAAARAPVQVEVKNAVVDALPGGDGEFDAAIVSLVLCSVPDQRTALAEIRRVLRPGGELRFYEHVISSRLWEARVQRLLDATIFPTVAAGCHCARDTDAAIRQAGFTVEAEQHLAVKVRSYRLAIPHILGTARRD
jgi:ubiquinone/menaquinone biosynthesis C-methylase UbiE